MTRIIAFLSVAVSLLGAIHYYLWMRFVRDPAWPAPWPRLLAAVLVGLALLLPLGMVAQRLAPPAVARAVAWPLFVWMGLMFLLFMYAAAADVGRWVALAALRLARGEALDGERRVFLARLIAGLGAASVGALGAWSVRRAVAGFSLKKIEVALAGFPEGMNPFTIVQLTDIHVGPTIGKDFIAKMVAMSNAQNPDLVAITGDLVDGSVEELADAVSPLRGLSARHGVFFVTGNHEYYSGVDAWIAHLGTLGVRVLRNERVKIGAGEEAFDLAGVDDYSAGGFGNGHGQDIKRSVSGRDTSKPLVLLAHQPRAVIEAAEHGVGLQLSGHTHGGQIWPFNWFVRLQQPFVEGFYRVRSTQLYVSPGTGYWGPPMRLGTSAEVTLITLKRAPKGDV